MQKFKLVPSAVITAILLLCAVFSAQSQSFKRDTIPVLMVVGDTSMHYVKNGWEKSQRVWWEYGYMIKEYHNNLENNFLYGHDYEKIVGYFIDDKTKSLNGWVVFSVVELK